jgi:cytochrome oxidase assembly protein ShyY1
VLRTALKPRWLALLAVVLVAAAVMARLGEWQLDRARQKGERDRQREAAAHPAVPVSSLLAPRAPFPVSAADRRVTAQGRWDAARQLLLPGRTLDGRTGLWVLTPLRLGDGSAVPVLRGWVADAAGPGADPAALPTGDVTVQGVLQPSEPVDDLQPGDVAGLPAGQVPRLAAPLLVQRWPYPLITGYVVQTASEPGPAATAAAALRAVPPDAGTGGLALQNLSYALQWWLFSAFGLFFWWRLVRDDHRGALRPAVADGNPPEPGPDDVGDDEHDAGSVPAPEVLAPDVPAPEAGGRP